MTRISLSGGLLLGLTLAAFLVGTSEVNVLADPVWAPVFGALLCLSLVPYFAAIRGVLLPAPRPALWIVLSVAVALRLLPLAAPPFLSSDIYRYAWDGMVQAAGINPYLHIPADTALAGLRDTAIYPHINRANYAPTIYPPAAQLVFVAIGLVKPSLLAVKLTMLGFEALAVGCLLALLDRAGLPRAQVLIYAWNPLSAWEFAGNGHVDAVAVGLLALALVLRVRGRHGWTGMVFALAVLVKFLPIAYGPALWRRGGAARLVAGGLATGVLLYALYGVWNGAGWKVLGFLRGYGSEEGFQTGAGLWPLAVLGHLAPLPAWLPKLYLAIVAGALAALALRIMTRDRPVPGSREEIISVCADASVMAVCLVLALTPHYAWYYGWLAVAATIRPTRIAIWLGCAPVLLYVAPAGDFLLWPSAIFVPALLLAWNDRRTTPFSRLSAQGTR